MAAGDVSVATTRPEAFYCSTYDGVDDVINVNGFIPKNVFGNNGIFSVSLWVTGGMVNDTEMLVGKGVSASERWSVAYQKTGTRLVCGLGGVYDQAVFTPAIDTTTWTHIVVTYDGTDARYYVNSTLKDTNAISFSGDYSTQAIKIGGGTAAASFLKGSLSDVRIYKSVLTQAQITALYNKQDVQENLIANWKFRDDATDEKGNYNGTASGCNYRPVDRTFANVLKAARAGATDKYLAEEVNGIILSSVIQET
jgi:hypothetical protein